MGNSQTKMKKKKNIEFDNLKRENLHTFNFQSLDESNDILLEKSPHIKLFIEYLKKNKINYQILDKVKESILFLKILTLVPKYFIINLNEKDTSNYLVDYNILSYYKKERFLDKEKFKNLYLLLLDPSINSMGEVLKKSSYIDFKKITLKEEYKRIIDTNIKISLKNELRKGLPLGIFNESNKLNELTGKEWIKFTKSWFVHNPPPRNKIEILHPAKFPETLIEEFIKFFTKKGQIILDPFLGTGSTAVASKNTERSCIGIEINKKYADIATSRLTQKSLDRWIDFEKNNNLQYLIFNDDSNNLEKIWKKNSLPLIDFCITSPPYWNQLKRSYMRQKTRKDEGLDTIYSDNPKDIGNIDDYKQFLNAQKEIFCKIYNVLKNKGYLVIITNNIFYNGRLYPLVFDTAISLSDKWILKDEKIWCQDDKALLPLGINNAWVANRCHQYCLIFRKEEN